MWQHDREVFMEVADKEEERANESEEPLSKQTYEVELRGQSFFKC
jgi:hypothetical protein